MGGFGLGLFRKKLFNSAGEGSFRRANRSDDAGLFEGGGPAVRHGHRRACPGEHRNVILAVTKDHGVLGTNAEVLSQHRERAALGDTWWHDLYDARIISDPG